MWIGKLPAPRLRELISSVRTVSHPSTIIPARIGEDAGAVDLGTCVLVSHVDPITEASAEAARLAVIVASNDVAVTGARPSWAQMLALLPPGLDQASLEELFRAVGEEASRLGIEVIGGHTEYSPGVSKPIVALYVMGCACRECLVSTSGARAGDYIVQVGYAGREGAMILASDFADILRERGVPQEVIEEARTGAWSVSIVDIAVELAENGLVSSMHDATEGGIVGALVEVALASGKTLLVEMDRILVDDAVQVIAERLGIDPLRLISSGALVATSSPDKAREVIRIAERLGRPARVIGRVLEGDPRLVLRGPGGEEYLYREPPRDEISRFW